MTQTRKNRPIPRAYAGLTLVIVYSALGDVAL